MQLALSERIRRNMDTFTPSEKLAAHALLASYPFAGLETVAQFASRASVSAPTILRFVSRLGFSSYPEFQRGLRSELEAQLETPVTKAPVHDGSSAGDQGDASLIHDVADRLQENIRATIDSTIPAVLNAVISALSDEKRNIHLHGGQFTGSYASYLATHLRMMRRGVTLLEQRNWKDRAMDMGRKDVLVLFDIRRYDPETLQLARTARSQGASVILITDTWLSPATREATHLLPAYIRTGHNWDSTVGILLLCETIITAVTHQLWPKAKERLSAMEQLREGM
ncbi:MurR/RpiR family transcriptional regulator [Paracoccus versutus]|nr:MurR/RpiR family transcriptional regulator [Paracoccus versutus]WGR54555.1 MurR/RpiR family transcriptional regulator [Paracoccus versutus]